MKRELEEYFINAGIALTVWGALCASALLILACLGCTPPVSNPYKFSGSRTSSIRVRDAASLQPRT